MAAFKSGIKIFLQDKQKFVFILFFCTPSLNTDKCRQTYHYNSVTLINVTNVTKTYICLFVCSSSELHVWVQSITTCWCHRHGQHRDAEHPAGGATQRGRAAGRRPHLPPHPPPHLRTRRPRTTKPKRGMQQQQRRRRRRQPRRCIV